MADKRRVLRIITRLNVGGPSIQAIDLSQANEIWETRLLSGHLKPGEKGLFEYLQGKDIDHHSLKHMEHAIHPIKDLFLILELICQIQKFKPDIVHTHHAKAGMVGRVAAMICGVPCVHTFHGNVFRGHYSPLFSKIICLIEKSLAPLAQGIVAISPTQKKDLVEVFSVVEENRCRVIPLGFHLERFIENKIQKKDARLELQLPEDLPLVAMVGRLTHVKNHLFFIEAFATLEESWHCVIIGDGTLEEALKKKVSDLNINERVHFKSTMKNIETAYAAADVLAITSHSEGTPVTMIEAMAAGLPVVAAAVGGIPDLASGGERALTYEADNQKEFVVALKEVLENVEASEERCEKAKTYALSTHTFKNLLSKVEALYKDLLF